jgi:uncharacterized membrane protein YkoI
LYNKFTVKGVKIMKKRMLTSTFVGLIIGSILAVCVTPVRSAEHEHDSGLSCSVTVPDPEPANLASLAKITAEDAKVKALTGQPDGTTVIEVELENEDGCLVYGVELSDGSEVTIDAGNGEVLQVEPAD